MLSLLPLLMTGAASTAAGLGLLLVTSERRTTVRTLCPQDQGPTELLLRGNKLDSAHWTDVEQCSRVQTSPLFTEQITCDKACLKGKLPPMK